MLMADGYMTSNTPLWRDSHFWKASDACQILPETYNAAMRVWLLLNSAVSIVPIFTSFDEESTT